MAEEVERSEAEIEGLRSSISGLTQRPTPLEALQQKKADLESDINKFESLIEKLREHKEAVERKSSEKHDDLQRAAEDLRRVEEENKDLEEDVTRMAQQRSKLKDILHSLTSQKDSLLDAALEDEAKFEKKVEEIEGASRQYHATADRLQLIPSTAKHAEGVDFEVSLKPHSEDGVGEPGGLCVDVQDQAEARSGRATGIVREEDQAGGRGDGRGPGEGGHGPGDEDRGDRQDQRRRRRIKKKNSKKKNHSCLGLLDGPGLSSNSESFCR